jgi:cobalt transporter subunit CbtA
MLRQIFYPGLLAGLIAGVFIFAAQQVEIIPLVFEAETYENAAADHGRAPAATPAEQSVHVHEDGSRHVHGADEWSPEDGLERTAFSLFSNLVTAIGFGLVIAAAISLTGRSYSWQQGVVWGLAGYVGVHLAPAFGLPPELPGMASEADLLARQTWAIATTALTVVGLALIAFRPTWAGRAAGIALIAAPHFFPIERVHVDHAIPVELVSQFIVSNLVVTGLFWMLLGGLTAWFSARAARPAGTPGLLRSSGPVAP